MWNCWLLINLVDFDIGVSILQLAMGKKWRQGPCSLVLSACGIDFCCVREELESAFETWWWDFVNDCVALVCAFFCKAVVLCDFVILRFCHSSCCFYLCSVVGMRDLFLLKEGMGRDEHSCNLLSFRTCRLVLHFVLEGLKILLSSNFIQDLLQKQLNNSIPEFLLMQFISSLINLCVRTNQTK